MKKIFVNKETLKEAVSYLNNEITFFGFYMHLKKFLKSLLLHPTTADIDDYLKENGLDRKSLIDILIEKNIIIKETEINTEYGEDKFYVSYKVPKQNFERKVERLFSYLFEKNEIEESILNEEGEGGGGATSCGSAMQGGGSNPDAGQFIVPLGKVQRRKIAHVTQEQAEFLKEYCQKNNKIKGIRHKK